MNAEPEDPMDTQLLQLERELFSLTPVDAPRRFTVQLDQQLSLPVAVGRIMALPHRVVPFRWRRIVVPAAAAVVVVSALNGVGNSRDGLRSAFNSNRTGSYTPVAQPPAVEVTSSYVLRADPLYMNPSAWEMQQHLYWISQDQIDLSRPNIPRQGIGLVPVSFH